MRQVLDIFAISLYEGGVEKGQTAKSAKKQKPKVEVPREESKVTEEEQVAFLHQLGKRHQNQIFKQIQFFKGGHGLNFLFIFFGGGLEGDTRRSDRARKPTAKAREYYHAKDAPPPPPP